MKNSYIFGSLFARPSFLGGVGRVVDLGSTMQKYNESKTEEEADVKALRNDWSAVGQDINKSILAYEQKMPSAKTKQQ